MAVQPGESCQLLGLGKKGLLYLFETVMHTGIWPSQIFRQFSQLKIKAFVANFQVQGAR